MRQEVGNHNQPNSLCVIGHHPTWLAPEERLRDFHQLPIDNHPGNNRSGKMDVGQLVVYQNISNSFQCHCSSPTHASFLNRIQFVLLVASLQDVSSLIQTYPTALLNHLVSAGWP